MSQNAGGDIPLPIYIYIYIYSCTLYIERAVQLWSGGLGRQSFGGDGKRQDAVPLEAERSGASERGGRRLMDAVFQRIHIHIHICIYVYTCRETCMYTCIHARLCTKTNMCVFMETVMARVSVSPFLGLQVYMYISRCSCVDFHPYVCGGLYICLLVMIPRVLFE